MLAVLAGVVVAPMSIAMAQQGSEVKLDLNLKDADMMSATNVLLQRTGLQCVIEPSSVPYQRVTLKLDSVTGEDALRYICQAAGAYFKRDENGVFIISHEKPVTEPPAPTTPSKVPKIVRKIKVMKAGARDIYDAIVGGMPFDVSRGLKALDQFAKLAQPSEVQRMYGAQADAGKLSQPQFGPAVVASPTPGNLNSGESGADIQLPGSGNEGSHQLGGAGGFGGGIGGGGQGGIGGGIGGGQGGIGGGQGGGQGSTRLVGGTGLVGESIDFISYDPTDNSLVVRGNEDDINDLQRNINIFDVAPRQVEIKVEFITTTDSISSDFGTEFLYQRGIISAGTTPGTFVNTSDPVFVNYASGNITSRLRASLAEGAGKVVSAPIIRTLNNQPATISSDIITYVFLNTTTVSNGTILTTSNPYPLEASTTLSVAPRINDDGTITVYLLPTIQSFVGTSQGPNGEQIPNEASQGIRVVARVKNNETIVLGGLVNKNENDSVNKVPILADLPIIGQFFRTNTKSKTNSELLIFVTPSIVDEDTSAGPGGP
ncbi:MAG: hypothetical protein P4L46_20185 [Fimbriimonas sp.]|nr:hypothetical protein [Fimbriimonas sp.]